ncbi:MAG: hypothetical protein WDM88_07330 [Galbitalea sp.]
MTGPVLTSPIVSTQWLADYLGSDKLVVLDATVLPYATAGRSGFLSVPRTVPRRGPHPGSDLRGSHRGVLRTDAKLPFTHQSAEAFAAAVGSVGIDNDTTVVVYDAAIGQWAAGCGAVPQLRLRLGRGARRRLHQVAAEGRDSEVGHLEPSPKTFVAHEAPELWVSKADVEDILAGTSSAALVCGLPPKEFSGEEGNRRGGDTSRRAPACPGRLVNRETNAFLPADGLRAAFGPRFDQDGSSPTAPRASRPRRRPRADPARPPQCRDLRRLAARVDRG